MPPIGIVSYLMNTTMEHGGKTPKNSLKQKAKKNWNLEKVKASNTLMKNQCPSLPTIIYIYHAQHFVPLLRVSLSKNKSSTGPIQTSKEQNLSGIILKATILMLPYPEW